MATLLRYGGSYLIEDLISEKTSAASIYDFNDPLELHLRVGRAPTALERRQRGREIRNRNDLLEHFKLLALDRKGKRNVRAKLSAQPEKFVPWEDMIEGQRENSYRTFDKVTKIVCCAKTMPPHPGEAPMWGYYADSHRGCRIHFNESFSNQFFNVDIQYSEDPVKFGFDEISDKSRLADFIDKLLRQKGSAWQHEQEVRLLIPNRTLVKGPDTRGTQRLWIPLRRGDITRVDLGLRFMKPDEAATKIKAYSDKIEVFVAAKDPDNYQYIYKTL